MIQERPLLLPLLVMAAGLVISDQTGYLLSYTFLVAIFVCFAMSCLIKWRLPFVICTALFFCAWGLSALSPWKAPPPESCNISYQAASTPVIVEGLVQSRPDISPDGSKFVIRTEQLIRNGRSEPVCGDLMLYVTDGELTLVRGDRIRCITRISIPRRLGLPGEFDFPRYLNFLGISAIG
jgi:competence protein ComEC